MRSSFLVILVLTVTTSAAATNPHDVEGVWVTEARDGHIEINDCGNGSPCGTLLWVDPATTDTLLDVRNANETLRPRPLVGVPIIWGYEKGKKQWQRGRLYNPEDGKTFRSSLKRLADGTLEVKGCLGPLCRINIWTQVDAPDGEMPQ